MMTIIKLPNTTMFKNITVSDIQHNYILKKHCGYCNKIATKRIIRTCIHTDKTQIIFVCDHCLENEIMGVKKYMRREAD